MTARKEDMELQRLLAFNVAEDYCKKNNLSVDKLKAQRFSLIYGKAFFSQPSSVKPDGLCNDVDTMPKTTLIIEADGDNLKVAQTEYTQKYLAL